jgi:hypothetical protein
VLYVTECRRWGRPRSPEAVVDWIIGGREATSQSVKKVRLRKVGADKLTRGSLLQSKKMDMIHPNKKCSTLS